ncbi:hypothetical protein F4804DRAFT_321322 [Jackrogersella minutella]|nr:hypothetical protein F4804DRAFT_321322 [Jackrogersella minutella]
MSSSLSIEAEVGIAVGVAFFAMGLGALLVFMLRRNKQRKAIRNNHCIGMPPAQYPGFQCQRGYTRNGGRSLCSQYAIKTSASNSFAKMAPISFPQDLPLEPMATELSSHWDR